MINIFGHTSHNAFFITFLTTFVLCILALGLRQGLVQSLKHQNHWIHDHDVVRLGGLAILVSTLITIFTLDNYRSNVGDNLLFCSLPLFLSGIAEDLGTKIRPLIRLGFGFVSSIIAAFVMGVWIKSVGVSPIDFLLAIPIIGLTLTVLLTVILTQCFNLIDGLNGLCSGIGIIFLSALLIMSPPETDAVLGPFLLCFIGGLTAFWLINIFSGNVFLGDSGAYLIGFLVAWVSVYLVNQTPNISPWACLLLTIYPVSETTITVVRRTLSRRSLLSPDSEHLHHLIQACFNKRFGPNRRLCNSLSSLFLLAPNFGVSALAIRFSGHSSICGLSAALFFIFYCIAYTYLRRLQRLPT